MEPLHRGDLVITPDGYYGLVVKPGGLVATVFTGNGLRSDYPAAALIAFPIHAEGERRNPARANFAEILAPEAPPRKVQYREEEGTFTGQWTALPGPCPRCGAPGEHEYRIWQSNDGAYEDVKHHCGACRSVWWVDGPDA